MSKKYLLFDSRAMGGDPDAICLDTADTESECREVSKERRKYREEAGVWFEYDLQPDGKTLLNPKQRMDL